MDNLRLILLAGIAFVGFLLWQEWQQDYGAVPAQEQDQPAKPEQADAGPPEPSGEHGGGRDVPEAPDRAESETPTAADTQGGSPVERGKRLHVETDVIRAEIDTVGGDIRRLELKDYAASSERQDELFVLLDDSADTLAIAQNGLLSDSAPAPTHRARYQADRTRYSLDGADDHLRVALHWQKDGVEVTKRYTFHRGRYTIDLAYEVRNNTGEPWRGRAYSQLQKRRVEDGGRGWLMPMGFRGGGYYDGSYHQRSLEDLKETPVELKTQGGWAALVQHYFVSAVLPPGDVENVLYGRPVNAERYIMGAWMPPAEVADGERAELTSRLYLGPQLQNRLGEVADGLELTVDYGIFTILAKPLFWLLSALHSLLGNWGWAIVALTFLIKLAFYKLSEAQYRSMAKMREFAPRIKALRERYADDKEKLNKEMMELYRKENFNPLGGCLPILVQLPVFIALYWVLRESVELRQADFIFWLDNLTSPDPYYVLPLLFGASMYAQQKMSASSMPMDPIQQRVMTFMPLGLMIFFAFFPSGLVLYWLVNNVLSIAQQWYIMRRVSAGKPAS